ncbi:MAG: helix-turn-helix domain-containing protein [Prosthecobacter sp.]|nr:helix-turn-helix domain-containing protein [Prosthecobacter sp.]
MKTASSSGTSAPLGYKDLPRDYSGLCKLLLPRPIHNRRQANRVGQLVDILAVHETRLSANQKDYLEILAELLESWDTAQAPDLAESTTPAAFLDLLLQTSGQTAASVARAVGFDRSALTRLLKGERAFTVAQARALAAHFAVDAGVFLGLSRQ